MIVHRLRLWIRDVFRRGAVERELDEELQFHLACEVQQYIESGLSPEEARRRARAEFGGLDALKEECRETRGAYALETTIQDFRYGARFLRRNPGFTLTAVLTLALTIGAVSSLLTLTHTFFLRRLPVPAPDELVEVSATRDEGTRRGFVSYPEYVQFRDATQAIPSLAAVYPTAPLFVTSGNEARQINGAVVSATFFPMLGVEPALGRFFLPEEDRVPDRDRVTVLGHDFWRVWFGESPDALGSTIDVNGVGFTVVGVAPATFRGIGTQPAEIYIPTMMLPVGYRSCSVLTDETCTILRMMGRLREGVSVEDADAEMATLIPERWTRAEPGDNSGVTVTVIRGADRSTADQQFIRLLALVGGVLLLVCCANLAGLLMARGGERTRELAIRTSLGAPSSRLLRQLLSESVLLALIGGAFGVLVSAAFTRALDSMFFSSDNAGRPLYFDFTLEPVVILAVLALSLAAGLLFGVAPALISVRSGANVGLRRQSAAMTARGGSSRWLLGAQAAIAVALVVVAALLSASASLLVNGLNFEPSHVALLRLRPRLVAYEPEQAQRYLRSVIDRLETFAGVESVTMVGTGAALAGFTAEVSASDSFAGSLTAGYIEVGPRYFETLGTPLLRGREFTRRDAVGSPRVAVMSEALANILSPEGDPIGTGVVVNDVPHTVIGLVADVALQNRAEPPRPYVFVPFWQNPNHVDARLQVRVAGDPAAMLPALTREILRVDPAVPVAETITLKQRMAGSFRGLRMSATVVGYAAGLAVILSAVGLYASLAAAVSRRTKEIGVRQALGASAHGILRLIAREGMTVILVGVGAGLGLGMVAARLLQHLLYGSAGGDAVFYGAATVIVTCVGFVACWVPARRAARIEPMAAIRRE